MVSISYTSFLYQMKVTLIQLDIEWGKPTENIKRIEIMMEKDSDNSDLYVLPEMWSTGFAIEPSGIAEDETTSISLEWMKKTAHDRHCAICGSLAVRVNGVYRNRHYYIDGRNGIVHHYDKHHLFSYGGEDQYYKAGEKHTIVNYMGYRILLLTCYDLRFPVWSRYANNLQFDVIVVVANWPVSRQNAWQILTRARAIENQAFLIGCNRVGYDHFSHYIGQSAIISPNGKTLAYCPSNKECIVSFYLNKLLLDHQRTKFAVLKDRDIF